MKKKKEEIKAWAVWAKHDTWITRYTGCEGQPYCLSIFLTKKDALKARRDMGKTDRFNVVPVKIKLTKD